jgi:DNA gyrase inhibitor GyrI/DNA-binding HxlR family transcriptional regulator
MDDVDCSGTVLKTLRDFGKDIAFLLHAVDHEKRMQIVTSLLTGVSTFKELQKVTNLGKTALSHHLGILVKAGVITHTGRGCYEVSCDGKELICAVTTVYADSQRRKKVEAAKRADYIKKVHTKEGYTMKEVDVRIVELEPMRVASVQAMSETPEHDAWEKMQKWAEPKGLLQNLKEHPVFGFNNPNPSPGKKEYGYEFWIRVGDDVEPEGDVKIKEVEGGLYAVATCNLKRELESEYFKEHGCLESWKKIVDWVESSKYKMGNHQCLEKATNPNAPDEEPILDLYCPIKE